MKAVFLVKKEKAESLRAPRDDEKRPGRAPDPTPGAGPQPGTEPAPTPAGDTPTSASTVSIASVQTRGCVPSESWNRLGPKVNSKLRSGTDLNIEVQCSVEVSASVAENLASEVAQALNDLGLQDVLKFQRS